MKKQYFIQLCCIILLTSLSLKGQSLEVNKQINARQRWQVGIILSDILYPKIAGEASFFIDDKHSLGIYSAYHGQRYEQVYDEINSNYNLGLFHRIAFNQPSELSMFFVKYGGRFSSANLSYTKTDWFPYSEDGYDYLIYEARDLMESPKIISYQLSIGYQEVTQPFFVEYYIGVNYHTILNKEELDPDHTIQRNQVFVNSQWLREGLSPILGVVVGLGY